MAVNTIAANLLPLGAPEEEQASLATLVGEVDCATYGDESEPETDEEEEESEQELVDSDEEAQ